MKKCWESNEKFVQNFEDKSSDQRWGCSWAIYSSKKWEHVARREGVLDSALDVSN